MENQLVPKKKTSIGRILLYILGIIIVISVISAIFSDEKPSVEENAVVETLDSTTNATLEIAVDTELDELKSRLKSKAKRDWPEDYITQEFWVNQQLEDYDYMKQLPDDKIKQKAMRDFPLDFTTQKFWYNEQIESKESLETN